MDPDTIRFEFLDREGIFQSAAGASVADASIVLKYVERNCFFNAVQNIRDIERLSGLSDLNVVAGSLGLCVPEPCWYEWGGSGDTPHQTVARFAKCPITGGQDAHFWLQAGDIILDVLDPYLINTVAVYHNKKIDVSTFMHGVLVQGTAEELESRGLRYVPADPLVQACLFKIRLRRNNLIQ